MDIMRFNDGIVHEDNPQNSTSVTIGGAGKSPKYVVKCGDFFSSTMDGLEDCAPCDWIKTGGSRITKFDSSGRINGDTVITGKDPIIRMQYGPWAPVLQQCMYQGTTLDEVGIYRLTDINGDKVIIQELHYYTCLIKTYDQEADKILFTFCFKILEDLQIAFDQEGNKLGKNGMQFDFTTLKVKDSG